MSSPVSEFALSVASVPAPSGEMSDVCGTSGVASATVGASAVLSFVCCCSVTSLSFEMGACVQEMVRSVEDGS